MVLLKEGGHVFWLGHVKRPPSDLVGQYSNYVASYI